MYLTRKICIIIIEHDNNLNASCEKGCMKLGFLLVLLCIGAYFHCKKNGTGCCHPHTSKNSHRNALDIVRERYARGEINSEEFNERKKALE